MAARRSLRQWLSETSIYVATNPTWVLIIVLLLSLSSSAFSIRYLSGLNSDISDIYENNIKGQTYAESAYVALLQMQSTAKDFVIADTQQTREATAAALSRDCDSLQSLVLKVTRTLNARRYRTLIARSKQDMTALSLAVHARFAADLSTLDEGRQLLADLETVVAPLRGDIATINDLKRSANNTRLLAVRIQLRITLVTTIAILLLSVAVRVFLYRSSRRSLRATQARVATEPGRRDKP